MALCRVVRAVQHLQLRLIFRLKRSLFKALPVDLAPVLQGRQNRVSTSSAFMHAKAAQAPVRLHMLDLGSEHIGCSLPSGDAPRYWLVWPPGSSATRQLLSVKAHHPADASILHVINTGTLEHGSAPDVSLASHS